MKNFKLLNKKNRKQNGYTMIELLLVIGIIIALTAVMLYALLSRANRQAAFTQAGSQVAQVANAERSLIAVQGAPIVGADLTGLASYGVTGKIVKDTQSAATANPWGGPITVANNGDGNFSVVLGGLPSGLSEEQYSSFVKQASAMGDDVAQSPPACSYANNSITCKYANA